MVRQDKTPAEPRLHPISSSRLEVSQPFSFLPLLASLPFPSTSSSPLSLRLTSQPRQTTALLLSREDERAADLLDLSQTRTASTDFEICSVGSHLTSWHLPILNLQPESVEEYVVFPTGDHSRFVPTADHFSICLQDGSRIKRTIINSRTAVFAAGKKRTCRTFQANETALPSHLFISAHPRPLNAAVSLVASGPNC